MIHKVKFYKLLNLVFFKKQILRSKELEYIDVPVLDKKQPGKYRLTKQPTLFPHRIMSYVFDEVGLDITDEQINLYWDRAIAAGEGWASAESRHRVPIGLYGDAAVLYTQVRREKLLCLWLNIPIWRPTSVRYSRFLLWSMEFKDLLPRKTINTVLRWIVWSLNAMWTGKHPMTRMGGRRLKQAEQGRAGSFLTRRQLEFQLTELRGDWEFHKLVWQLPACGWTSLHVCFKCTACSKSRDPNLLYWNFDDNNSRWHREEFSTAEFIAYRLPEEHVCNFAALGTLTFNLNLGNLSTFIFKFLLKENVS